MSEEKRKNLKDVMEELDKYFEDFEKDLQNAIRESITLSRFQKEPFVAGFSFKLGPEGRPSVQIFGDRPMDEGYRSPMSEQIIDDKNNKLRIVLEMPGVEKGDIKVDATEERAIILAERENRKYRAELRLKTEVRPDSGIAEYRNGVLDISFSMKDKANKDF